MEKLGTDTFRRVDGEGAVEAYRLLDEEYGKAEAVIPTRFREYEHKSHEEYYAVKNNFYYLFGMAERVKKAFYGGGEILRIAVSTVEVQETATLCLLAERFKLSVREPGGAGALCIRKDIPTVYFSIFMLNKLLQADIYGIVKRFIEPSYESDEIQEYSIMRLTGQSCKIDLFRDSLKEFIPGRIIESSNRGGEDPGRHGLKLMCLDGAIQYIRDKRFGYAQVTIQNERAAFPYTVSALTHTGEERPLIRSMDRRGAGGHISRTMADLTLQLRLRDMDGNTRYTYSYQANPDGFEPVEADEIVDRHKGRIIQDDVDSIVDRELRFFVLPDGERWGFTVVPVLREDEQLKMGPDTFFQFETEGWLMNFFDGMK